MLHKFTNKQVANLLKEIAACYEIKNENAFKIRAYDNASSVIEKLDSDIGNLWAENSLENVPCIGKSLEEHLSELFKTGKVKHFDEVKKEFPQGMFELLNVPGIGAKTAFKLAKEFNLDSPKKALSQIKELAEKGKIRGLSGFGEESENRILQ
ncbi:MAG: DNA polymerase III, partial [bacterium]